MRAPIDVVTEQGAVQALMDAAQSRRGHWTITANLDHLRRYHAEPLAKDLLEDADSVVADGMPLIWASRVAGTPLPERVSGSSMILSICKAASISDQSIFLLGGNPGVAERAAQILEKEYPGLRVAGTACPPMGFEHHQHELAQLRYQLIEVAPQIVFVALGFPKQDCLIRLLRESLPGASFLGVGISLSYVTGDLSRAPSWICRLGLEWAYRLSQEPTRRLAQRYLVDGLMFAPRLTTFATRRRVCRKAQRDPASDDDAVAADNMHEPV